MARIKENAVMIDFYLCPTLLQKEILEQYQELAQDGKDRETFLTFIEEKYLVEIRSNTSSNQFTA